MEQTNRTILFEEVNSEKEDILSFVIGDQIPESLNDDDLDEIHSKLEVSSFEEALDKFEPKLFLGLDVANQKVECAREKRLLPKADYNQIIVVDINKDYPLLKIFRETIAAKKTGINCTADSLLTNMFPVKDLFNFQKEINRVVRMVLAGDDEQAVKIFNTVIDGYDDCLFLIHSYVELAQEIYLERINSRDKVIVIDDNKDLQVKTYKCSDYFYKCAQKLNENQIEIVEGFFNSNLNDENVYCKKLWMSLLSLFLYDSQKNINSNITKYKEYSSYLKKIMYSYWEKYSELMEILLGIFVFFDQYQTKNPIMPPKLVIANVKPEKIIDIRNRQKLDIYLKSANQKNYYNTVIWYAIVPKLEWKDEQNSGSIRQRFLGNEDHFRKNGNSSQQIQVLINLLAEYHIQSFVSPIIDDKSSIRNMLSSGIDEWIDLQYEIADGGHAQYIYPCIPNFIIMPSEHTESVLCRQLSLDEWGELKEEKQYIKLWLKNIGVEASYVAAGLYAACQCPGYLSTYYRRNVDLGLPGVRYSLVDQERKKPIHSTIKMNVLRYSEELIQALNRKKVGVIFIPSKDGAKIFADYSASYMYGKDDSVSQVQTLTYMERQIQYYTQDFKSELIKQFFQNRPGSLSEKWSQNKSMINSILQVGENMTYNIDEKNGNCTFEVTFQSGKKEDTVRINKN